MSRRRRRRRRRKSDLPDIVVALDVNFMEERVTPVLVSDVGFHLHGNVLG